MKKYHDYYRLGGKRAYPCTQDQWAKRFSGRNRQVAVTEFANKWVSTVFLGSNHDFSGKGPPKIFETMVFPKGGHSEEYCARYSTWGQAERGHWLAVWKTLDSGDLSD